MTAPAPKQIKAMQEWFDTLDQLSAGEATEADVTEAAEFVDALDALEECTCRPDSVEVCPVCKAYLQTKEMEF